jgi:ribosomal protein S18 acetylase RimI-like enzyme
MTQDPTVEQAGHQHFAEVEALVKLAYQEFQGYFPETAWSAWMDNISKVVHSETGIILMAVESGKIRGVVKFYPDAASSESGQWPPGAAAIRILAVHPAHRGQGLGRRLVQECLDRARILKIPKIYLYTGSFMKAARRLYERFGFQRIPEYDKEPGPLAYGLDVPQS